MAQPTGSAFEFTLQAQRGRNRRVEGSTNLTDWTTRYTVPGANIPILLRDAEVPVSRRLYCAIAP